MTVRLETSIHRYIGLSTDVKPEPGLIVDDRKVTAADVPVGSTFLDADTEERWHWTGLEWRAEDSREVRALKENTGLLEEVVRQLTLLRHSLVLGGIAEDIDDTIG